MNKLKTRIPGLDTLFHGGLQIEKVTVRSEEDSGKEGMVIVIRGAKGTGRTKLALQLMQGLYLSLCESSPELVFGQSLFYSISQSKETLEDSYLDMIIAQGLRDIVRNYRIERFKSDGRVCDGIEGRRYIQALLDFLFDSDNEGRDNMTKNEARKRNNEININLPRMICEGIVYYNSRTNSLHFKRPFNGDDADNLVASRRHDTIGKYIADSMDKSNERLYNCSSLSIKNFMRGLINVEFNDGGLSEKSVKMDVPRNPMNIFRNIENNIYNRNYGISYDSEKKDEDEKRNSRYDVLVIEGFSKLKNEDLEQLSYSNLLNQVRRLSKISILVFDDRESVKCDGDVIIDMRSEISEREEYMLNRLRITKSVFQTSVLGWHQYKDREEGIEVYPSPHYLMSKRHYISSIRKQIGHSLFEAGYSQFLEAKQYEECIHRKVNDCPVATSYFDYLKNHEQWEKEQQKKAFREYAKSIGSQYSSSPCEDSLENPVEDLEKVLFIDNLFNNDKEREKEKAKENCADAACREKLDKWVDHFPATAIIGNPNSYKRFLALATSYSLAKSKVHTLFLLFDKNELDMRRHLICPACIQNNSDKIETECFACCRFIHTYTLRMGCITAEEFFEILLDQISLYCNPSQKTETEQSCLHIVIDDIQKIDFSFPFLNSTTLFLSTLVDLCHEHKVKLTILCDKSADLVHEVCSLVDTVIAIRRDEDDIYDIELNVERNCDNLVPSRIVRFNIHDILRMFTCDGKRIGIQNSMHTQLSSETNEQNNVQSSADNKRIKARLIGSMKEYWRKTGNVVFKSGHLKSND